MKLLFGEANSPVAVGGVPQDGEDGPGLRQRCAAHAFWGRRVYGHTCCPIAVVEQDLHDQTSHGVSNEDGWLLRLFLLFEEQLLVSQSASAAHTASSSACLSASKTTGLPDTRVCCALMETVTERLPSALAAAN